MKTTLLLLLCITTIAYSQNFNSNDWRGFKDDDMEHITVTNKTKEFSIKDFVFNIDWDNKLNYSDNIGHYGGIKTLKIYKKGELINTFTNIEDMIALGKINFRFYDYNFDGYIDFTIPINDRFEAYYLYNPVTKKYEHSEDWDYLRVFKINKKAKQILSTPDGNYGKSELYQVNGNKISEIKK